MTNSSGSSFWFAPLPIFDGKYYNIWQKKMVTFFMSQDLWHLVQNGKTLTAPIAQQQIHEEERKDLQALYYIQQSVTPAIFYKFISAPSAKTAWDFLEAEYNSQAYKFLEDIDFHTIEIPENLDTPTWIQCIGEFPRDLRDLNPAVYTPELISIGPLHHGRPELANMQKHKLHYAKCFLNRIGKQKDLFVVYIKQHEKSIRGCYYKESELSSKDYVEMILLDSFFIFEFFHRGIEANSIAGDSSGHDEVTLRKNILVDLMLFENQLPLSLLFELYKIALYKIAFETSFKDICVGNLRVIFRFLFVYREFYVEMDKQLHFTGLVRYFTCSGMAEKQMKGWIRFDILDCSLDYGARKLSESNVKFFGLVSTGLERIRLEKRKLFLPLLIVNNTTKRVYSNLIGLEHRDEFKEEAYVISYILLLRFLIIDSDDVAVLVKDGVIFNELGSNQAVVDMFHRLGKSIFSKGYSFNFYFRDLCVELNHYCSSWKGWTNYCRKLLKDGYFNNIWKGTATVAAAILLLLTLTQTITSIMQVM